jgi:alpha-beta hydrolase superfamily lysophospholipase
MTSLADHALIQSRYFFPRPDTFRAGTELAQGIRVSVPAGARGVALDCYHRAPYPGGLTIVHFHGNGEVVADYVGDFTDALVGLGANLFLAEYRGYGRSSGTPALAGMLDDVPAIVEAAGAPVERLVFMGRSVGSIYAIHAVSRFPGAAGLILESGIASPLERILLRVRPAELGVSAAQLGAAFAEHLDHQSKLRAWTGPTLLLHARHDDLVTLDHAERNYQWAGGDKTLEVFERGDHNTLMALNFEGYMRCIGSFLARLAVR